MVLSQKTVIVFSMVLEQYIEILILALMEELLKSMKCH